MYIDVKRLINTVKVEDGHIILSKPLELWKYGKKVIIDQVNYYYDWEPFTLYLGRFLNCWYNYCKELKLPDDLNDLKNFQDNLNMILQNKVWGKKAFKWLIYSSTISTNMKKRWMKKKFKKDDWIEIFVYVYLYNVLGVKKNLSNVLELKKEIQSH